MRRTMITLAAIVYLVGFFLTYGAMWHEEIRQCSSKLAVSMSCQPFVMPRIAFSAFFWPLTWGIKIGIDVTASQNLIAGGAA